MIYAPVVIPTLNRSAHFKRLIESLKRNPLAIETELYIGIDFPPDEKYRSGYMEICEYAKDIKGFKRANIYIHDRNLGPYHNMKFLVDKACESYDRYISTEDDNEFSPNFLEYMNRGLERYQNDERVIGICGHAYDVDWGLPDDSLLKLDCAYDAWGIGIWNHKNKALEEKITESYLKNLMNDLKRTLHLLRVNPYLFSRCVEMAIYHKGPAYDRDGGFTIIDTAMCIFMIDQKYYTINPILSKVRNWGDDGSGVHCGNENRNRSQILDEATDYVYPDESEIISGAILQKKMRKYLKGCVLEHGKSLLIWSFYWAGAKIRQVLT